MKDWIAQQGIGVYLMMGMALIGIIGNILCRVFYGRLAREAQVCGTSDYPMLHYIRQKYTSYYKLGMRPSNAMVIVRRYLSLHKVGFLSLSAWRKMTLLMVACISLNGLVGAIYLYESAAQSNRVIAYLGMSLVSSVIVWLVHIILDTDNQYHIIENAICDYLDNYLKSKLDGEYGYTNPVTNPKHYARALKETAATKAANSQGVVKSVMTANRRAYPSERAEMMTLQSERDVKTSSVDAKIVEDVLKEFLS